MDRPLDKVLVLHSPSADTPCARDKLESRLPGVEFREVHSVSDYISALRVGAFDITVIDYDIPEAQDRGLLTTLKLLECEPDVVISSRCDNPLTIKRIAETHKRYVVRDEQWVDSIEQAIRDTFRIRRLEREMSEVRAKLTEANRQLQERNSRLDEFCATIAHDIRGPLAGLTLKVEHILDAYHLHLPQRCRAMLRRSVDSAHRLAGVVEAMYDLAKLGAQGLSRGVVDLSSLIEEVIADICVPEGRRLDARVDRLPPVYGNAELLRRVFNNLFSNSVKYSNGLEVSVSIRDLTGERASESEAVIIEFTDSGPGISEQDAPFIFGMFKRGKTASSGAEGLGVGLAVVSRILELHGGAIELLPRGQRPGSVFRIELPRRPVAELDIGPSRH